MYLGQALGGAGQREELVRQTLGVMETMRAIGLD